MTPETLIEEVTRLSPIHKKALAHLGLKTIRDVLYYFPSRYSELGQHKNIKDLIPGESSIICGKVASAKTLKAFRSKIPMAEVVIEDNTGKIKAIWFHQAYMAKKAEVGKIVELSGVVNKDKNDHLSMVNPLLRETDCIDIANANTLFETDSMTVAPVYPETRGISSLWFSHFVKKVLAAKVHEQLFDPIPESILKKYNLPSLKSALVFIHTPQKENDALAAKKRFAFEEIFFIQVARQKDKAEYQKHKSFLISKADTYIKEFTDRFPFKLTNAQQRAIGDILGDLKKEQPMTRLLEGDVGSGKTAVAAACAFATVTTRPVGQDFGRLEVAYMVPTEILAKQHFDSFIKYFEHLNLNVGLITGSGCFKFPSKTNPSNYTAISRTQFLKWVANGEIPIVVGTHALIQEKVKFKNLALVIIDEQHRFGTNQRAKLVRKKAAVKIESKKKTQPLATAPTPVPHLLSMTATPIPRTLALTIYGDLDLTLLDQMPLGRLPLITEIVLPSQRQSTYDRIKKELEAGRQVYVICPRISEPDPQKENAINAKSVKDEARRLKEKIFTEYEIGILHGKMTPKEKDETMGKFYSGQINILVATSVVEVGMNVPNATVIIIEGAERFGLAQLHQLRGRVLRSTHQAYCYIFTESKSEKTMERLLAIKTAKNGFELSENDLALRGAGELGGKKQWGISDLGMEAIKNIKMVEAARQEAQDIIKTNPDLNNYPLLKEQVGRPGNIPHFE
jgi:ATP-dependent DNA helicase RecG